MVRKYLVPRRHSLRNKWYKCIMELLFEDFEIISEGVATSFHKLILALHSSSFKPKKINITKNFIYTGRINIYLARKTMWNVLDWRPSHFIWSKIGSANWKTQWRPCSTMRTSRIVMKWGCGKTIAVSILFRDVAAIVRSLIHLRSCAFPE